MSGHKDRYKNLGLNATEMRRRREEEGIQLRKQKREQQLAKRRNVNESIIDNINDSDVSNCLRRNVKESIIDNINDGCMSN